MPCVLKKFHLSFYLSIKYSGLVTAWAIHLNWRTNGVRLVLLCF